MIDQTGLTANGHLIVFVFSMYIVYYIISVYATSVMVNIKTVIGQYFYQIGSHLISNFKMMQNKEFTTYWLFIFILRTFYHHDRIYRIRVKNILYTAINNSVFILLCHMKYK